MNFGIELVLGSRFQCVWRKWDRFRRRDEFKLIWVGYLESKLIWLLLMFFDVDFGWYLGIDIDCWLGIKKLIGVECCNSICDYFWFDIVDWNVDSLFGREIDFDWWCSDSSHLGIDWNWWVLLTKCWCRLILRTLWWIREAQKRVSLDFKGIVDFENWISNEQRRVIIQWFYKTSHRCIRRVDMI